MLQAAGTQNSQCAHLWLQGGSAVRGAQEPALRRLTLAHPGACSYWACPLSPGLSPQSQAEPQSPGNMAFTSRNQPARQEAHTSLPTEERLGERQRQQERRPRCPRNVLAQTRPRGCSPCASPDPLPASPVTAFTPVSEGNSQQSLVTHKAIKITKCYH